ncbi:MAG: tyrosine--tRNA ligase [Lachnospiraceae bacterium]|nr:tyrosine--tRNA ligase [Lachnospiraceae bacterium]
MKLSEELHARGLLAQMTDEKEINDLIDNGKATFYIGFDPTADSLHVGHFMALLLMKRLQMAGNKPIALVGGGTAMIGDPSGRSDMRKMMTIETIDHNVECFKRQMSRFIDFGPGKAQIVNNADWLRNLNFLDFMRDIGPCFSVNEMLRARAYVNRMQNGLSFLEFSYMLMQSYDFYRLFQDYGCQIQFGGDDQWSNMLGGIDLIRKKLNKDAYAMTICLLLKHDGTKMGKTSGGAVWLDPDKTSPYDFYQYWRNVDDADVLKFLRMMTFLPLEQIDEMDKWEGSQLNEAKRILARELTTLVHGEDEAKKAEAGANALFGGTGAVGEGGNVPETELKDDDFQADGTIDILALLVKGGLAPSRAEARRNVQQGGVTAGDEKVTDPKKAYTKDDLKDGVLLKRGKKKFVKAVYRA